VRLRHLETFVAIVDAQTLTAAAARLYKTQAAVSQDLKSLEASLGVTLIDRSGQRIELTSAGRALLPMARKLLTDLADAEFEMARIRRGELPIVRIGCLPSLSLQLASLVSSFALLQPDVRWSVNVGLRDVTLAGLRDGSLDLALCDSSSDADLEAHPLGRETLRVVVRRNHPLAGYSAVTPQDLADMPYVSLAAASEASRFLAGAEQVPAAVAEVNDSRLAVYLVAGLSGFAILPASVEVDESELALLPTFPPAVRQIALVSLAGRQLPSSVAAFAEHVQQEWVAAN
jgi:DNA-binding transcriptional LysR family regulator